MRTPWIKTLFALILTVAVTVPPPVSHCGFHLYCSADSIAPNLWEVAGFLTAGLLLASAARDLYRNLLASSVYDSKFAYHVIDPPEGKFPIVLPYDV